MSTQMKRAAVAGMFVLAGMAMPLLASAQSGNADFPDLFWTELRMKQMDTNKDGMVSREEYMAYMGAQYDKMDHKKTGKLGRADFLNKQMMRTTFTPPQSD